MTAVFITVLNMSLTGTFIIMTLCFVRLILKNSPRIFLYLLWIAAGLRLVLPFSIGIPLSWTPLQSEPMPMLAPVPVDVVLPAIPDVGSVVAAAPLQCVNSLEMWLTIASIIWLCGVALMLFHGAASLIILKRRLKEAVSVEPKIYEAKALKTPFVIGFFTPMIYLPAFLTPQERRYIILHEQTHIARNDHIVKLAAYFVLSLHWFNPFVWMALRLLNMDMEMSCDDRVLKSLGGGTELKKDYSSALLSLACERRFIGGGALSFSAGNVGKRVRNVLSTKRPSYAAFGLIIFLVLVLSIGFSINLFGAEAAGYYAEAEPVQIDTATSYYVDAEPPVQANTAASYYPAAQPAQTDIAATFYMDAETPQTEYTSGYYAVPPRTQRGFPPDHNTDWESIQAEPLERCYFGEYIFHSFFPTFVCCDEERY